MDADAFYARLKRFEGRRMGQPGVARDPVNQPMIRHWCDAVDDRNPVYTDPEFAKESLHGGIVAPPTMLQAWTMRGLRPPAPEGDRGPASYDDLFVLLDDAGFTSVVATNCTQEYHRYLRPGDHLSVTRTIESVSPEKKTALGEGHFVTQRHSYHDGRGEEVASMSFRMLKFRPGTGPPAPKDATRKRPRPGITHDVRFFWEGLEQGRLLIQRCDACGVLRHPPGPACAGCGSFEWDSVEACGRGSVYSWVAMHHPAVAPFEYPNLVVLVELEEGTRLVSQLVGVTREQVAIGMPVVAEIVEVEEGYRLHQFRPARES